MDKIKSYLPVIIFAGVILLAVNFFVLNKEKKENNIIDKGIKTEAIIENVEKLFYYKNKIKQKQFYYELTLKYSDKEKNIYKNKATIKDYKFKGQKGGDKIEIIYLPENPNEIVLTDNIKAQKTEGRLLLPSDLLVFNKNKDLKTIYSELNKISNGWKIDKIDSTLFLNEKRKSFIYIRKDSIAYYNNSLLMTNNSRIENDLNNFNKIESKRAGKKPMNIDPFNPIDKPIMNLTSQKQVNHYQKNNFNIYSSEISDYSNKAWFSLILKSSAEN